MKKYILKVGELQPGDIILIGYNNKLAEKIKVATNSRFSHAMLYWEDSVLHADDIVITENPSRLLFEEGQDVAVLRLKEDLRCEYRIQRLIEYARSLVGTFYDKDAIIAMLRKTEVKYSDNRQMCSKYIAQCYDHVQIDIVDDYNTCSPQDIYVCEDFDRYEDFLVEATEKEIEFAKSPSITGVQRKTLYDLFMEMNLTFPNEDIVTFSQVFDYICKHPNQDGKIVKIISDSKYLQLWKIEKDYCPYLYDPDRFVEMWGDKSKAQAINVVRRSNAIIRDKMKEMACFEMAIFKYGELDFFKMLINLDKDIIHSEKERIKTADEVLLRFGVMKVNIPH